MKRTLIGSAFAYLVAANLAVAQPAPPTAPPAFAQPAAPTQPAGAAPGQAPQTARPAGLPAPAAPSAPNSAMTGSVQNGPTLAEQFAIISVKRDTAISAGMARTAADLSALKSEPRLQKYDLSKVVLEGNANPTKKADQTEVGISWGAVARTDMKDKRETLPRPWESRIAVPNSKPVLTEGERISAKGDMDMMVKAIDRLFAADEKQPEVSKDQPKQQSSAGTAAAPAAAPSRQNDMAQYQPLPNVEADKPDSFSTSSAGCPIRIDLAAMTAYQQGQTLKNGEPQGDCSDNGKSFAIEKTYASCTDTTDMQAMLAFAGFRRFYVNESGETRWLDTDCQPDTQTPFAIQEDLEACGWQVNHQQKQAQKLSLFYYNNRNNKRQEVTSCATSAKTAPIATTLDKNACPVRYDLAGNTVYEQGKTTWAWNDKSFSDGPCLDTAVTWPIFYDYNNCPPHIDYEKNKVWKTSRAAYTKDSQTVYIDSTCGIKPTDAADLTKSSSACTGDLVDNFPGQVTYGTSKYGYDFGSGMVYVSGCNLDDSISYPHQVRRTGWQNNDAELFAYEQKEIYIVANGTEIVRQAGTVLAGTPKSPYIFDKTETRNDSTTPPEYVGGCNKYTQTAVFDIYKRPDATEFEKKTGAGSPVGPVDVCVTTLIDNKRLTTGYYYQMFHEVGDSNSQSYWYQRMWVTGLVQKHQMKNAETGAIVGNTCKFDSGGWYSGNGGIMDSQVLNWHWTNLGPPGPPVQQMFLPGACPF